eukprot:gene6948-9502_t
MEFECLTSEIDRLKTELKVEREMRIKLEDECDLLALANEDLRNELLCLKEGGSNANVVPIASTNFSLESMNGKADHTSVVLLDEIGTDTVLNFQQISRIVDAHSCKNVLSISYIYNILLPNGIIGDGILSGGVDNCITLRSNDNNSIKMEETGNFPVIWSLKLSAPVLTIDVNQRLIGCGLMDGKIYVIDLDIFKFNQSNFDLSDPSVTFDGIVKYADHSKYVISIKWNNDGTMLATASYDRTVHLYSRREDNSLEKLRFLEFQTCPESIAFTSPFINNNNEDNDLIIGLRDVSFLIYVNIHSFIQQEISLNENNWDTHVSFTPLQLAVSPNSQYLLVSTDKDMIIIYKIKTNQRIRLLCGHICGQYSKPIAIWDPTSRFIICNSDDDSSSIIIYSLSKARIVEKLRGHN